MYKTRIKEKWWFGQCGRTWLVWNSFFNINYSNTDKFNIHFNAMRDDADRESFGAGLWIFFLFLLNRWCFVFLLYCISYLGLCICFIFKIKCFSKAMLDSFFLSLEKLGFFIGINGSMKKLEHPWNRSHAEKVLLQSKTTFKMFFNMVILWTVHWKVLVETQKMVLPWHHCKNTLLELFNSK